ncbi:hypothetical protein JX265_003127 [Neoarthrinium moseri]|uniref:Uncharacterized protein n=1 Tax=Neoarthrinium moseri TaxID=1658444 RepID=A0A9Q0AUA0_9PEZI|nr:hypothetical protein JX265_003127 [Neoarthrinium moseri]
MVPNVALNPGLLAEAASKTVIITGGANGIGAATTRLYNTQGANIVVADLAPCRKAADELIRSLPNPPRAVFIPTDILDWAQMTNLFKEALRRFGSIDIVVANAGIMETSPVLDENAVDENGDLLESTEGFRVIDINLKGTLNTLRLALHYMRSSPEKSAGGSIVLVASTSGYFGGTGVAGYVASKHGVVGLLRSSQQAAHKANVRVNAIAPFVTPTYITASYVDKWREAGYVANTPEGVAAAIAQISLDTTRKGNSIMISGNIVREVEMTRAALMGSWLGEDLVELMAVSGKFFEELGGYPLPKKRAQDEDI